MHHRGLLQKNSRLHALRSILKIFESPILDLEKFANQAAHGSARWLRERESFRQWINNSETEPNAPRLFCLAGLPGTGKSTIAAITAEYLQETFLEHGCQHYFFTESHSTKKTIAYCLRSIAFQVGTTSAEFGDRLIRLHQDVGDVLSSAKYQTIWARVFEGILFKMGFGYTLHWVLDAVDEAEDPRGLLKLISQHTGASSQIKVMLLSRPSNEISGLAGIHDTVTTQGTKHDIRNYVQSVVARTIPSESHIHIHARIVDQIVSKTEGSFLWARLALDTLAENWHTLGDIQKVLDTIPNDMQHMYRKMLRTLQTQTQSQQTQQNMAQRILTWATCGFRPMTIAELQMALEPEFGAFVNLRSSIIQICGYFVRVDGDSVSLIHATARGFLIAPYGNEAAFVPPEEGHERLAMACLR